MLAGEDEEAIRLGREALAMAEELRLDDVRAAALNNLGSARANLGDEQGLTDLAEAIRLAERANAPFELCRAKGNLAAMLWVRGQLARSLELSRGATDPVATDGTWKLPEYRRATAVALTYASTGTGSVTINQSGGGALTATVLDAAVRQQSDWQRAGIQLTMAVNLSASNLLDQSLSSALARLA